MIYMSLFVGHGLARPVMLILQCLQTHVSLYVQVHGVALDLGPFAWIHFVVQCFSLPGLGLAVARECTVKSVLKGSSSPTQCSVVLNTAWLHRVQFQVIRDQHYLLYSFGKN